MAVSVEKRTGEIAAANIERVTVCSSLTRMTLGMYISHTLQVREIGVAFDQFIWKAEIIFLNATESATAEETARTNSFSMVVRFHWRFSRPPIVGGVRFSNAVLIYRIN